MPKRVDHDARRAKLVDATCALVAREGLGAATVRRIAAEAGCTTGLVTHYFPGKDAVLLAALRRVHAAASARMAAALRGRDGLDALAAVLHEALPLDAVRVAEWTVWVAFWSAAVASPTLVAEQERRYDEWRGLVHRLLRAARRRRELAPHVDVTLAAAHVVALVDGLGVQGLLESRRLPPRRLRRLADTFVTQLRQR